MPSGFCGDYLMWWLEDNTLTISGTGEMNNYSNEQKKMAPWYSHEKLINNIVIENGITSIGEEAFFFCFSLRRAIIPASVTSIGNGAFAGCTNLTSVTIPDSVTSIGFGVFFCCTSLTRMTIPASVISINYNIFDGCTSLKEIHYPAGRGFEELLPEGNNAKLIPYTSTPKPARKPKSKPANELKFIPVVNQITKPVAEKLRWKVEGKTLTVGGVREIKFYSYSDLPWVDSLDVIQKIVIEEGVEKISAEAFSECKRLELLTIPASVKTIGDFAFTFCYCGDRSINGGKNVIWSLADGVLMFKKNPAVKIATNFSLGAVSWRDVEKNVTGIKIERGITPDKRFFDWLGGLSSDVPVSF